MSAPKNNRNAVKPAAEKRQAPAIYLRPTAGERKEIMAWARGAKLSKKCMEAILDAARGRTSLPSGSVRDIRVCHLPYQDGPFVVGTITDPRAPTGIADVWLRQDGSWTPLESDPECALKIGHWNPK